MKQFQASPRKMAQVRALVATLRRSVEFMNFDIDAEEERSGIRNVSDPAYPTLARHLRIRRDNLAETVSALLARLENELPTSEYQHSEILTGEVAPTC